MTNLSQKAISAALAHSWDESITINKQILVENKNDIDALNRMAYALSQLGKTEEAKKLYRRIISLDKFNCIAIKNLEKISSIGKINRCISSTRSILSPILFIEEPGKTKTVALTNIAPKSVLAKLHIGDQVMLYPKKHSIEIRDTEKVYIGALPDDIAFRLIRLITGGNVYEACIKNIQKKQISVFIKECKRGKKFINQPSFPPPLVKQTTTGNKAHKNEDEENNDEKSQDESDE